MQVFRHSISITVPALRLRPCFVPSVVSRCSPTSSDRNKCLSSCKCSTSDTFSSFSVWILKSAFCAHKNGYHENCFDLCGKTVFTITQSTGSDKYRCHWRWSPLGNFLYGVQQSQRLLTCQKQGFSAKI